MQIQITFDSTKDLDELREFFTNFDKFYQEKTVNFEKIDVQVPINIGEDRTNYGFNELKEHEDKDENEKNSEKIMLLEQQLKNAVEKLERLERENSQLKNAKTELENQSQKCELEFKKITEEKNDLRKRLNVYEPILDGDVSNKYFKIEDLNLTETGYENAPFIGKVGMDGKVIFHFNEENGPHEKYSQDPSELTAFCDIIESIDGANHISLGKCGTGTFYGAGLLRVESKAEIKLTRE